jgi:hypothetical protein
MNGKFGWSYPPGAANDPMAPYNQQEDDEHCVYCGADLPDDVTGYSQTDLDGVDEGFCNATCLHAWIENGEQPSDNWGKPHFTPEQEERRKRLHNAIFEWGRKPKGPQLAKLEDVTEHLPEGDFKWDDLEAGDWHVYCCGEKDCPQQWHTVAYTEEFERKDGKLSITLHSVDQDGNWDVDGGWEEGEEFDTSEVAYALGQNRMDEYFKSWAEYWIDAAITGNDPCDQINKPVIATEWIDFCLDAAADNVKYLTKGATL